MYYTKQERKDIAKAFKLALSLIERQEHRFICLALGQLYTECRISPDIYAASKAIIRNRLGFSSTYEGWVEAHHYKLWREARSDVRRRIKSLVAEFSK